MVLGRAASALGPAEPISWTSLSDPSQRSWNGTARGGGWRSTASAFSRTAASRRTTVASATARPRSRLPERPPGNTPALPEHAPSPEEIYKRTREEGRRRLSRPLLELAATALVGGFDIAFGVAALGLASGAVETRSGTG